MRGVGVSNKFDAKIINHKIENGGLGDVAK